MVHHSFCGTTTLTPELLFEEFHDHYHADITTMFDHDSLAIMDFEVSLKHDIALLRSSPADGGIETNPSYELIERSLTRSCSIK